jgi:ParB/RepB/Spo0J family partition protein
VADNADVIQGRLGWESGDISEADPEALEPHRKNKEIYGDTDEASDLDETFRESVGEKGVLEPLVITDGKQIISGHRRWLAAKAAGLDSVPVRYSEFDSELAEREALVEFNRQREKTPGQIVNEFEEMLAVERERAKERKERAGKENLQNVSGGNSSTTDGGGKARENAAEKVNADVSGRTLEKGKKVKDKAESDDEPGAADQG